MNRGKRLEIVLVLVALGLLTACAGKGTVYQVPGGGEAEVVLKATSFAFDPGVIKARQGEVLRLRVENEAGIDHNLTIVDPSGATLHDVNLPAGKTVVVEVSLTEGGTYAYYCDRPMHTTFGMSGRIEVTPRP